MVKYDIAAETLDCSCCELDGLPVPELRYHLCTRRVGIVGRVLKPLIERRRYYKKMKKEPGPLQDVYTGRDTILKWTLVTCLDGRTVIPYKMNGQRLMKPISEIIDPLLPDGGMADAPDELRLFGFDSNLCLVEKKASKVLKVKSPPTMLRIGLQKGQEIVATPNHRFFVLSVKDGLDVRRADELHIGDYLTATTNLPRDSHSVHDAKRADKNLAQSELTFLRVQEVDEVAPQTDFVYCFEMEEELNGFITQGNLFVGNSFGYQGYKNARFGRIECHEAINAFARNILVRTMEIAESHGYEVVHGIVDSVWLRPTANADPIEKDREVRPRPRDPRTPVHPDEERLAGPPGIRRLDGNRGGPEADGEARLRGRTRRIRAICPFGRPRPRFRAQGARRGVPPGRRGTGRVGVHPPLVPVGTDAPGAVRVHGGEAGPDVRRPLRYFDREHAGAGDHDSRRLQVNRREPEPSPRRRRVQEAMAGR